jgi:HD-like signal output (HDOD) protein
MYKILIAEDDYAITLALQTILKNNFDCELTIVHNGEEAINEIHQQEFNLILSDWNMPLITGFELLNHVRNSQLAKCTPFFLLTARADKSSVVDAVKAGVNGYIHKPFDRTDLIHKITEALNVNKADDEPTKPAKRKIVDEIVERLKTENYALPALSDVADKVSKMITENTVSAQQIAELIKSDPVITARLVALSNSASYRGVKKCSTLVDAITRIGLKDTANYIWLFHNNNLFESKDKNFSHILQKLRDHSLACAECCRLVAKHLQQKNSDEYFYMGLLHDIGAVLILTILKEIHSDQPMPDSQSLAQTCADLHSQFTAALTKRWKMPEELQSIALYHDNLSEATEPSTPLLVVHFSNLYVRHLGFSPNWREPQEIDFATLDSTTKLALDSDFIASLEPQIKDYMNEIHKMM